MRLTTMMMVSLLALTGCPDEGDDGEPAAMGGAGGTGAAGGMGGAGGGAGGLCDVVDCGPGTCVLVDDLPACECDPGFMVQGLTCVDRSVEDAPADFECPAPGGDDDPIVQAMTRAEYALVNNDRSCRVFQKTIVAFRDTGVFVFREQDDEAGPDDGGTVLYGCWSLGEAAADRVTINYDYAEDNAPARNRNCGRIGALEDPPCAGIISYLPDDDALYLIAAEESYDERVLLYAVPENLECTFCGDDPGCCPNPSWVADGSGPLCE